MNLRFFFLSLLFLSLACQEKSNNDSAKEKNASNNEAYDEKTACLLSQIAYCKAPQQSLDKYLPGWKLVWEAKEIEGTHALIASNGTVYALAIRGSLIEFSWTAFQNWIYQDLNVTSLEKWNYTDDSSNAKIAQGSFDAFQNLIRLTDSKSGKTVSTFLEENTGEKTPILLTGHSLGGNLCTVYASWLWQHFKKVDRPRNNIDVITFAAPAAGNKAFAEDFNNKFPKSQRFENKNDIVPKFPCSSAISGLGELFNSTLSASTIDVGYKSATMSLSRVFSLISTALIVMEFTNGNAVYTQTNGKGDQITIDLSGKNTTNDIGSWLSEAGYQHGIARYATKLEVAVVNCDE